MTTELIISMAEDGKVTIHGPLTDKISCYGLLEIARDIVRDYQIPKQDKQDSFSELKIVE